jgi:hypothetical protein
MKHKHDTDILTLIIREQSRGQKPKNKRNYILIKWIEDTSLRSVNNRV